MGSYMLIRAIWTIYGVVAAIMIAGILSQSIFSKKNDRSASDTAKDIALSLVWPFAMFSKAGRAALFGKKEEKE